MKGGEEMKEVWSKPQITEIKIAMTENGNVPKVGSAEDGWTNAGMGTGVLKPHKG
jgi:hypothetical protein